MGGLAKYQFVFVVGLLSLLMGCAQFTIQPSEPVPTMSPIKVPEPPSPAISQDPWILVDTKADTLTLMKGEKPLEVFDNIAIGSRGAGTKRRSGDEITPLGVFRVGWINKKSRYHLFIGLDYPNLDYTEQAYREGRIDGVTYLRIRRALEEGRTPPQDTPLGGYIGIHGLGEGDPYVHNNMNWTGGCVALNNQQIRNLAQWVQVGTQVEIR